MSFKDSIDYPLQLNTIAARAGHQSDQETGAVIAPIHVSTTFERDADGSYPTGNVYARVGNPTRNKLEKILASLEGSTDCATFASGSAATASVFQTLSSGDHVLVSEDCYHGTMNILKTIFTRWGLQSSFVDMTNLEAIKHSILPNTKLLWLETPSNPMLKITEIKKVSDLAHSVNALCVADNTWATPMLQNPLNLGADLVVHSTTKYLGGHSDVLGGAVIASQDSPVFQSIREIQMTVGGVPSPFDCWLILRGLRTLHLRMQAHCDNAKLIAYFLEDHCAVESVHYPGLKSNPGHEVASNQMRDFGGMLSFQVKGGKQEALLTAARTKLFTRATSLGGTESLIEHRASIEGPNSTTPNNLLRVSVGIEDPNDLIRDLERALS